MNKTHFVTTNMWRFTWKRQMHGTVLVHSVPTTLEYFRYQGKWLRSMSRRRAQEAARRIARQPSGYEHDDELRHEGHQDAWHLCAYEAIP